MKKEYIEPDIEIISLDSAIFTDGVITSAGVCTSFVCESDTMF